MGWSPCAVRWPIVLASLVVVFLVVPLLAAGGAPGAGPTESSDLTAAAVASPDSGTLPAYGSGATAHDGRSTGDQELLTDDPTLALEETTTRGRTATNQEEAPDPFAQQDGPEADATVTRVSVDADGTAEWELTIRTRLETDEDVEEFEAFQEEFRTNRSQYVGQFESRMTGVVDSAEQVTDREMRAENFQGEAGIQEVPRRWGFVSYRFTWDGFATTDGDAVVVGDVFQGGFFLEADDILVVAGPAEYESTEIRPEPDAVDDGDLQWSGPQEFDDQRPSIRYEPGTDDSTGGGGDGAPDGSDGTMPTTALLVVVLLVAGAAVGLYARQTDRGPDILSGGGRSGSNGQTSTNGSGPVANGVGTGGEQGGSATESNRDHRRSGAPDSAHADAQGNDRTQGDDSDDPLELGDLATDEDRVAALLEAEGGRMRQADIGDYFDWSDSKTSRVLSGMNDEGKVEKLRIGRENVIDLAPEDGADGE